MEVTRPGRDICTVLGCSNFVAWLIDSDLVAPGRGGEATK